jgi:hypothetical protein
VTELSTLLPGQSPIVTVSFVAIVIELPAPASINEPQTSTQSETWENALCVKVKYYTVFLL